MYFWRKKQHRKLRRDIYSFFDTSLSIALCEVGPKQGAIEQFFYLGFAATVKS